MDGRDNEEVLSRENHGYDLLNNVSDATTVYADGCIFLSRVGAAIRISFVESILEPANGPNPGLKTRHVANVVMPTEGFLNALQYMNRTVVDWQALDAEALENGDEDGTKPKQ